jgi:hypothetical protein
MDMESQSVFVVTSGSGSLDLYSQRLAENLIADTLVIDVGRRSGDGFNQPLFSTSTLARVLTDWQIVRSLRRSGSLVHLPNHHLARYGPFLSAPYVVTVHDLIRWFDVRADAPLISRPNLRDRLHLKLDLAGIRRADGVIAVSHATKRDLVAAGVEADRISVVHSGVDQRRFRPVAGRPLEDPYVLFVGTEQPRKNLATLLAAFAQLRRNPQFSRLRLIKVGPPGGREARFRDETLAAIRRLGLERDVIFTGWIADEDLPRNTRQPSASSCRRFTRASACPPWKQWRAAAQLSSRLTLLSLRFAAGRLYRSTLWTPPPLQVRSPLSRLIAACAATSAIADSAERVRFHGYRQRGRRNAFTRTR